VIVPEVVQPNARQLISAEFASRGFLGFIEPA